MREIEVGKVYRHFKGNYYYVLNIALHSETQEKMVVYKALYNDDVWIRPLDMFMDDIDPNRAGNITGQSHRLELAEDIKKNYQI